MSIVIGNSPRIVNWSPSQVITHYLKYSNHVFTTGKEQKRKKKEKKEKKKKEDGLHQKRKPDCYMRAGFAIQGNQLPCCRYPFYCISSLSGAIFLIRLHKGPWDETKLRSPVCITHAKRSHAHKYRSCSPYFVYTCTKITYTQIQILQFTFCIHMHKDHIHTYLGPEVQFNGL